MGDDAALAPAASRFNGLTVLVVEDETLIYLLIEDMLSELGCAEIQHATNVAGALAILEQSRPDVVLLDVNLAGEPAFPIAAHLAARKIPFIFATGYGKQGMPDEWSPQLVIQKPFRVETLAAALKGVLR